MYENMHIFCKSRCCQQSSSSYTSTTANYPTLPNKPTSHTTPNFSTILKPPYPYCPYNPFCSYCHEKVDMKEFFTNPWEKTSQQWAFFLDFLRFIVRNSFFSVLSFDRYTLVLAVGPVFFLCNHRSPLKFTSHFQAFFHVYSCFLFVAGCIQSNDSDRYTHRFVHRMVRYQGCKGDESMVREARESAI